MSELFETAIIEKRNVLNEIRASNLTLQELRFFSIYLSKINPRDENTRSVKFPFADFKKIMDFGTRLDKINAERNMATVLGMEFLSTPEPDTCMALMSGLCLRVIPLRLWHA